MGILMITGRWIQLFAPLLRIFSRSTGGNWDLPVWFRLWIDSGGLVHRAEMRAPGHFMDHRYYGFDAPIAIRPPKGATR
jgi:hypothetical protein